MDSIEELKRELKRLQDKRIEETNIKRLKKQIKAEEFGQTKGGKIFNKIANIGDAGFRATSKFLSDRPQTNSKGKKKKRKPSATVEKIMKRLPQ